MFKWVSPFMWAACRVVAFIFQAVGLLGIFIVFLIAIRELSKYIEKGM